MTVREPVRVVGAVIPWNVPMYRWHSRLLRLLWLETVVVKSAEEILLLFTGVSTHQSDFTPGVFNIVSGFGPTCGAPLAEHPDVAKVTFTGSVETGKSSTKQRRRS